jgi:hypothetical protein
MIALFRHPMLRHEAGATIDVPKSDIRHFRC